MLYDFLNPLRFFHSFKGALALGKLSVIKFILLLGFRLFILLALCVWLFQNWLLFPRFATGCVFPIDQAMTKGTSLGVTPWPSKADYKGFILPAKENEKGTVVVVHGNGCTALATVDMFRPLANFGYNVIFYEFPGYGGRGGYPGVNSIGEDLAKTLSSLDSPYYLVGISIGCAISTSAVSRLEPSKLPKGLLLLTPWNNLTSLAVEKLSILGYLASPSSLASDLNAYTGPVTIMGATNDSVIPVRHARALYAILPQRKKYFEVGGDHNDWPMEISWYAGIESLLNIPKYNIVSSLQ